MSTQPKHVWICRDLSNGSAPGETYVWVHPTRQKARRQFWEHQAAQHRGRNELSRLRSPERISEQALRRAYAPVVNCVLPNYWQLRADRTT